VQAARERQLPLAEVSDFENLAGKGVQGRIGEAKVIIGSARLLRQSGVPLSTHLSAIEEREARAQTVVGVARGGVLIGIIAIADTLKEDAAAAVARLHEQSIETVMITGDNHKTAEVLARQIGVKRVLAEVLPQDKAEQVRQLQAEGKRVAFVGDGINDAPALAQADLGGQHRASQRPPAEDHRGAGAIARHLPDHQAEPVLGVFLQRRRYSPRGIWTLEPNGGSRRDGALKRERGWKQPKDQEAALVLSERRRRETLIRLRKFQAGARLRRSRA